MKQISSYSIGLDIGTSSVGYSVIDNQGNLLKFKKQNMWGVRLFEEGKTAVDRRIFRATRRRYDRRRERIRLLQEFFASEINKVDSDFFLRLGESKLWLEDRTLPTKQTFFDELGFTDKNYYKKFPTIYHLRQLLINHTEKQDIRLVYLALHHIVKYRGNFLYEGQRFDLMGSQQLRGTLVNLLSLTGERLNCENVDTVADEIIVKIDTPKLTKSQRTEQILNCLRFDKEDKSFFTNLVKALVGQKARMDQIFAEDNQDEAKSIALSEDEKIEDFAKELDDEQVDFLEAMKAVYSGMVLKDIIKGENVRYLSDAKVLIFEKHRSDLDKLKKIYKALGSAEYRAMFKIKVGSKPTKEKSYSSYRLGEKWCSQADLYNKLKKDLSEVKDPANIKLSKECLDDIESETFLPRSTTKSNGVIPYQVHLAELRKILENQGKHYKGLKDSSQKLETLVTFRIPYYVGPLVNNTKSAFAWMSRKVDKAKIYPWNFEDVVDKETSAEEFIFRMTGNCTYLPGEKVIPKKSLLYSEYEVLNEIKQIKANSHFLPLEEKQAIYTDLFMKHKSVSENLIKNYLIREWHYSQDTSLTGFQMEEGFASSLTSHIDFSKILGDINIGNISMIETLILWITLFTDKSLLRSKIVKNYPILTDNQVDRIVKLNYSGWSRLSRKLLEGLPIINSKGRRQSIIDTMRLSNMNFMQVITNKELGFDQLIENESKEYAERESNDFIDDLVTSPKTKRAIKQSIQVVEEIVHILGKQPTRIALEFAREEGVKKRTRPRFNKIEEKYKDLVQSNEHLELLNELRQNQKRLDDRAVLLYFEQNGKCLYSGKRLNLESLSQDCEIDHIIPRSYIKDDSFENLALVLKGENQKKSDNMLVHKDIIRSHIAWWSELKRTGMMGEKKFNNLTRDSFETNELKGFINRQLVETRQIIKHVANLFRSIYPESTVHEIKADLTYNLRDQFGYIKVREVNDLHHAHDAFLTAIMSHHIVSCYPKLADEFDYGSYLKFASNRLQALRRAKNGFLIGRFAEKIPDMSTGEVIWDGENEVNRIRKCLAYKDCFISKKTEENTGAFYDQTLYGPNAKNNLLAQNEKLDPKKYGGFSSEKEAYATIIEYGKENHRQKKIVSIPIHIVSLAKSKPTIIEEFLLKEYENVRILTQKIGQLQLILYKGHEFYISSADEIHNAKQLILDAKSLGIISRMLTEPQHVDEEEYSYLYDVLLVKIKRHYSFYKSFSEKLSEAREEYVICDIESKAKIIREVLKVTKAAPIRANFSNLDFGTMTSSEGRTRISLNIDETIFVYTSVTGMLSNSKEGSKL